MKTQNQTPEHPANEELAAFALGKEVANAETIAEHVANCARCETLIAKTPRDTFLGILNKAKPGESLTGPYVPNTASPTADELPEELRAQTKYTFLKKLGGGGMGVVYLAEHNLMKRKVAVKLIPPELIGNPAVRERFLQEVVSAAALEHPNVVYAYAAEEFGPYMVFEMEFVDGKDLSQVVKMKGPLPVNYAVNYIRQAAQALQHALLKGLVHRDIKPGNLMLTRAGSVKVADFGLAKFSRESDKGRDHSLTGANAMMGTPDYMAPEQSRNAKGADIRADIYSLGCTFCYLLTGQPPFAGVSIADLIIKHWEAPRPDVASLRNDVPEELAQYIQKMMAKEPGDRPQTPKEVVGWLGRFAKGKPTDSVTSQMPKHETAAIVHEQIGAACVFRDVAAWDTDAVGSRMHRKKKWPLIAGAIACLLACLAIWSAVGAFKGNTPEGIEPRSAARSQSTAPEGKKEQLKKKLVQPSLTATEVKSDDSSNDVAKLPLPETVAKNEAPKEPAVPPKPPTSPAPIVRGKEMTFDLGNGVKLDLIKIDAKGKKFAMGSPKGEFGRVEFLFDAEEQHEVAFGHDFYMGKFEVTQEQYKTIMDQNPSRFPFDLKNPVESVSWNDVQAFMTKINEKFQGHKVQFRLPSEAEWEYACRGGTTTAYHFGATLTKTQANFDGAVTKPVGSFSPNAFGLCDMHGNVWEWCEDYYGPYTGAPKDGTARKVKQTERQLDEDRVCRGGDFNYPAIYCRSAYRRPDRRSGRPVFTDGKTRVEIYGFRVVAVSEDQSMPPAKEVANIEPEPEPKMEIKEKQPKPGEERVFDVGNGVQITCCWIPGSNGKFKIGSPKKEHDYVVRTFLKGKSSTWLDSENEYLIEGVDGFWMSKYEITQSQYVKLTGQKNPSHFCTDGFGKDKVKGLNTDDFPVENVSWQESQACIRMMKTPPGLRRISLPSEVQWEWAARGGLGNGTAFYWGDALNGDMANCNGEVPYGSTKRGKSLRRTAKVGSYEDKARHSWRLCDMAGNVWEWCLDYTGPYDKLPMQKNPVQTARPATGNRVIRGGSWDYTPGGCRSANRGDVSPDYHNVGLGFRVVLLPNFGNEPMIDAKVEPIAQEKKVFKLQTGQNIRLKCADAQDESWLLEGDAIDGSVRIVKRAENNPSTTWRVSVENRGIRLISFQDPTMPRWLNGGTVRGTLDCPHDNRGTGTFWEFVSVRENVFEVKCLGHIPGFRWLHADTASGGVRLQKKPNVSAVSKWVVEIVGP